MSDRIKGFIVALERDFKDEDAVHIQDAISMIRGVLKVEPQILGIKIDDWANRERIRRELEQKLWRALSEEDIKKK